MKIPDEYICDLCSYVFLDGEVSEKFCPNCGSSMVVKEMTYDELLDDDEAFHAHYHFKSFENEGM